MVRNSYDLNTSSVQHSKDRIRDGIATGLGGVDVECDFVLPTMKIDWLHHLIFLIKSSSESGNLDYLTDCSQLRFEKVDVLNYCKYFFLEF